MSYLLRYLWRVRLLLAWLGCAINAVKCSLELTKTVGFSARKMKSGNALCCGVMSLPSLGMSSEKDGECLFRATMLQIG